MSNQISILAWEGYNGIIQKIKEEFLRFLMDINWCGEVNRDDPILVGEGKNSQEILRRFVDAPEDYDIVIVDWEYRDYYSHLVIPLVQPRRKYKPNLEESIYLPAFEGIDLFGKKSEFLPLRFGTNGFICQENCNITNLWEFYLQEKTSKNDKIVFVWDWWLPNLMLLAKACGFPIPNLTSSQFSEFEKFVKQKLFPQPEKIKKIRELKPLIQNHQKVDRCLGPSEMVAVPIYKKINKEKMKWVIPRTGLLWLESASISSETQNEDLAFCFLTFLQREEIQDELIGDEDNGYCAYPIRNIHTPKISTHLSVLKKTRMIEKNVQANIKYDYLEEIAKKLKIGELIMRQLPNHTDQWRELWNDLVKEILPYEQNS